jgi:hypothetical protein
MFCSLIPIFISGILQAASKRVSPFSAASMTVISPEAAAQFIGTASYIM